MPPRAKKENHGIDIFFFSFFSFAMHYGYGVPTKFYAYGKRFETRMLKFMRLFILSNFATFIKKTRKCAANTITIALFERDSDLFECDTKIEIRLIALYFSIK